MENENVKYYLATEGEGLNSTETCGCIRRNWVFIFVEVLTKFIC